MKVPNFFNFHGFTKRFFPKCLSINITNYNNIIILCNLVKEYYYIRVGVPQMFNVRYYIPNYDDLSKLIIPFASDS